MASDNREGGRVAAGTGRQVGHVRDAIKREFEGLIHLDDFGNRDPGQREQAFLSRGLAALFARGLTDCDSATAAKFVIDGRDDYGIDAVAILDGAPRIWLIQSKWSDRGSAGFGVGDALKLINGLHRIDQHQYGRLNDRFASLASQVNVALNNPHAQVTLLVAVMGPGELSSEVVECFEDAKRQFNSLGPTLDYEVRNAVDAWQIIRNDFAEPTIELEVKMQQSIHITQPFEAFYGNVPAGEIAQWYEEHSERLFSQNIRKFLGLTNVNYGIVETLTEDPDAFWYFNNGITVLCDTIEAVPWSRSSPHGPVTLKLSNASVVNGAQTVAATHEAMRKGGELAERAYVGVRVISVKGCPEGFGTQVTKATNTQNHVDRRDFVSLDPAQSGVREDFLLSLQKTYVVKRGEMDPPPDAGCSVVEAATALACAHSDPRLVVRVKVTPEMLWEEGSHGIYAKLFSRPPSAQQIWRCVLLYRAVGAALHNSRHERSGRAASIAEHGNLLVAHLVFQYVGVDHFEDSDEDWERFVAQVPEVTAKVMAWLIYRVDAEFSASAFIVSTFTNEQRCRLLVERVLSDIERDEPVPETPPEYRPVPVQRHRRPNVVPTLVDSGRITDGAALSFKMGTGAEREALADWLAEDPLRAQATWVNERSKPLLWSVDGKRYSPSGLVMHMWKLARWESAWVSVQGTTRWVVPGEGTLAECADAVLVERDTGDE